MPQKARWDTLRWTCVFGSWGICGSRSALRCVQGAKHRHTIFQAWVGPVRIPQKAQRTRYAKQMFLHPVGSVGHVVHCVVSGTQNIDALFIMLLWDRYGFHKKRDGTRYAKLVFLHPEGSASQELHSGGYWVQNCHTQFFCQNQVLIVCMTQDQLFHTYGPKVFTDNQMSRIKYNYYISNVSKDYDDSQQNGTAEDFITSQERQPGQHIT